MLTAAERMEMEINAHAARLQDEQCARRADSFRQAKMELRASLAARDLTDLEDELQSVRALIPARQWDGLGMKQFWIISAAQLRAAIARKLAAQ